MGDVSKIKVQILISELEYEHNKFYSRLQADERKQFAVCVARVLKDHKLTAPAELFFSLASWVFIANRGWTNQLDLDAFENHIPNIATEAIHLWKSQKPNAPFTLVHYTQKDKIKACCSKQCCRGFRGALTGLFSKNNTRALEIHQSFSPSAQSSASIQALSVEPVQTQSPIASDLELTAVKTHCQG